MKSRFNLNAAGPWFVVRSLFLVVLLALAIPSVMLAQQYSGTVTGTVTDPTGGSVAGVTVTATNVGTNATYDAITSDLGVYNFAQLPVGTYDISVKGSGFKESIAKGVEVHTSTVTEANIALQMGAASEVVTVEASDVQVQTTSSAVGEVVSGTQVRELPLNGENFMQLVTLSPGVSTSKDFNGRDKGLTGGSNFSVNGNPYTNNLFLVDGVNNVDMGSGRTILVYPSVDAIAEFKMIRNSYGPEYGQASGAIISINTKSGENQYHGGVFYAGRNDKLNANDWFSNFNGTGKAELRRNDWGYHASGPILKDKLFVFWNQEWNREIRGQSVARCVPTTDEKAGDFSSDVNSALAFLNSTPTANATNVGQVTTCGATPPATFTKTGAIWSATSTIPVANQAVGNPFAFNAVDPAGALLAQFYPDPNIAGATGFNGANNWRSSENQTTDWSEWNIRADYDLTKKNRITFRYTNDSWTSPAPNPNLFWGDTVFPSLQSDWAQPSKSVMAKLTTQIGSTMVNDIEFGYGHNAIITSLTPSSATYVGAVNAAIPTAWPTALKQSGAFINGGGAWGGLAPYGSNETMWTIAPYGNHEDLYALQDNVSKVHGNHLFKVGVYYSTNAKVEDNNGGTDQPAFPTNPFSCATPAPAGCVSGVQTNNPLANFLLPGQVFNSNENSVNALDRRIWHDVEWYVGDTWKIKRNVTINYGFRWSFYREPYSQTNQQANFSLADWSAARAAAFPSDACNGVVVVPGTDPCGAAVATLAALGIDLPLSSGTPGVNRALVRQNNHDIAPRVGIAWDVRGDGKTAVRIGGGQFFQRELVGIGRTLSQTAPFVINATDPRTFGTAGSLANPAVSPNAAKDTSPVTPNSWQWNVSVERELARNTALQVGYVGNTGIHLTSMEDLNRVPEANWVEGAFSNGSALNSLRSATNFGTIGEFARGGHASYHSLQALFRSRLGDFSNFQIAYTYSHSIGDVELDNSSGGLNQEAFINPSNTGIDKGNTNINRPHIFVANEVFYLPKLTDKNAIVRGALGGWEVNSIVSITSGSSLSVFTNGASGDSITYTCPAGSTWTKCTDPANTTGMVTVSSPLNSLTGTGFNQNNRPDIGSVGCNSGQDGRQILNPQGFTLVGYTLGTIGNAARGSCFGPHNRNFDFQFAKNWIFKEHYRLKFSLDMFNIFNHANFPGNDLEGAGFSGGGLHCNDAVGPCGVAVNPATGVTNDLTNNIVSAQDSGANSNFGRTGAVHPGRELQYTLKFTF
jgi:Carboxypeptidase regulatory-like domain/TonB-dependent Receptor Plug Domain